MQEPGGPEMQSIKQESLEHAAWPGPAGSPHSSTDVASRTKRTGGTPAGKLCVLVLTRVCTISHR